jgi:hypothetical protein
MPLLVRFHVLDAYLIHVRSRDLPRLRKGSHVRDSRHWCHRREQVTLERRVNMNWSIFSEDFDLSAK